MPEKELEAIKNTLKAWDFNVNLFEVSPELPLKQVSVYLEGEPELQVVIYFLSDLLKLDPQVNEVSEQMDESGTDLLQIFMQFPLELNEKAISDLARFMHMINWSTPIGAFGINESQKILYYRNVIECMQNGPDPELVADTVNGMELFARQRFDLLQKISSGEKSLDEILEELRANNQFDMEFPGYDL